MASSGAAPAFNFGSSSSTPVLTVSEAAAVLATKEADWVRLCAWWKDMRRWPEYETFMPEVRAKYIAVNEKNDWGYKWALLSEVQRMETSIVAVMHEIVGISQEFRTWMRDRGCVCDTSPDAAKHAPPSKTVHARTCPFSVMNDADREYIDKQLFNAATRSYVNVTLCIDKITTHDAPYRAMMKDMIPAERALITARADHARAVAVRDAYGAAIRG